jgi:hypothetical protein
MTVQPCSIEPTFVIETRKQTQSDPSGPSRIQQEITRHPGPGYHILQARAQKVSKRALHVVCSSVLAIRCMRSRFNSMRHLTTLSCPPRTMYIHPAGEKSSHFRRFGRNGELPGASNMLPFLSTAFHPIHDATAMLARDMDPQYACVPFLARCARKKSGASGGPYNSPDTEQARQDRWTVVFEALSRAGPCCVLASASSRSGAANCRWNRRATLYRVCNTRRKGMTAGQEWHHTLRSHTHS